MTHPSQPSPHRDDVRRAVLPEILFVPDVRLALGYRSETAARRAIVSGTCGPYLRLGRRLAVRRESLLQSLADQEIDPHDSPLGDAS